MKRSISILIVFSVAVLLLNGCSKDSARESMFEDTYRFFVSGNFDSAQVNLYAGEDSTVLTTEYAEDNMLVKMSGQLGDPGDPSKNSFELIFTGERLAASNIFTASSVMQLGDFALADQSGYTRMPDYYLVSCYVNNPVAGDSYTWKRNGTNIGTFTSYYDLTLSKEQLENTRFTLETSNALGTCFGSVYHEINNAEDSSWANIDAFLGPDLKLAVASNYGSPVKSVSWFKDGTKMGDTQTISTAANLSATYEAHVYFEDGSRHVTGITTDLVNFPSLCAPNFSMDIKPATIYNSQNVNTVEVIYHDANGKRFSSYYENNVGEFTLENVSQYDNNENNDPTLRFGFWGDMILKADDGTEIDCSVTGNMAVAYPQQ